MNTKRFFSLLFCLAGTFLPLAAQEGGPSDEEMIYAEIASTINGVRAPYLKGDYVIFTQENNARYIGIAFDFENFRTIHQFQIKSLYNTEYEVADSIFFYILKLPKDVQTLNYRLVVDGLWTTDPLNGNRQFSQEAGIMLSQLNVARTIPFITEKKDDGYVHFVYTGPAGQKVRLGGSFTNWDSWIYEMKEVSPGLYRCDLPLPPGTYEYAYYTGVKSFPDRTNPQRCYTADGKVASLLIVQ